MVSQRNQNWDPPLWGPKWLPDVTLLVKLGDGKIEFFPWLLFSTLGASRSQFRREQPQ